MADVKKKPIVVDDSRWPLVLVTMPAREVSDEEFADHLLDMNELATRGSPFAVVVDSRFAPPPSAKRRRLVADVMDHHFRLYGPRCFAFAVVMSSPVARGAFQALQWLRKTTQPMTAVATPEEGIDWVRRCQMQVEKKAV